MKYVSIVDQSQATDSNYNVKFSITDNQSGEILYTVSSLVGRDANIELVKFCFYSNLIEHISEQDWLLVHN